MIFLPIFYFKIFSYHILLLSENHDLYEKNNIKYFSCSFIYDSKKKHIFCRTKFVLLYKQKYSFKLFLQRALYICGAHRNSIVHGVDLNVCALCNKKRNGKKPRLAPMHMFTITYRY